MSDQPDASVSESTAAFWQWVEEYVCRPHPEIGREGDVCPFLPGIVRDGGLQVVVEETLDGTDAAAMEARVREEIPVFEAIPLKPWQKAYVILFPKVVIAQADVVDRVQAALKPDAVRMGLMVGQFHPNSTEPGARNPEFFANRAPVVAIALRYMSYHDIVFLDRDPDWFREYQSRYAQKICGPDVDPFLVDRYHAAVARFGAQQAGSRPDAG